MFVDKKADDTCPRMHTLFSFCMHSTSTRAHGGAHTRTWIYTHTHTEKKKKKTLRDMLVSPHKHCSQLLLTTHTIMKKNKKTMMRQGSCCVFGGLLTISQLAEEQTKAVIFRAGLLCIITKDGAWWHLTKQPVRRPSYSQTVALIKDKICR